MRVIFDIHIDIPTESLDTDCGPYKGDNLDRSLRTKLSYNEYADKLNANKAEYAEKCGADFIHYTRDQKYLDYLEDVQSRHPYLSEYLVINFYKHHLMWELADKYDEILYVDFDVVFTTDENKFEVWDFSEGLHMWTEDWSERVFEHMDNKLHLRSMPNKHMIAHAMLAEEFIEVEVPVINTGIIGSTAEWIKKLDYPGNLDHMIELVNTIKRDTDSMYSKNVQSSFDWNNEPMMTYLVQVNEVPYVSTNGPWNACISESHAYTCKDSIRDVKLAHFINKRFDWIWP